MASKQGTEIMNNNESSNIDGIVYIYIYIYIYYL